MKFYEGMDGSGRMILTREFEDSIRREYQRRGFQYPSVRVRANDAARVVRSSDRARYPAPMARIDRIPVQHAPVDAIGWQQSLGNESVASYARAQRGIDTDGAYRSYLEDVRKRFPRAQILIDSDLADELNLPNRRSPGLDRAPMSLREQLEDEVEWSRRRL